MWQEDECCGWGGGSDSDRRRAESEPCGDRHRDSDRRHGKGPFGRLAAVRIRTIRIEPAHQKKTESEADRVNYRFNEDASRTAPTNVKAMDDRPTVSDDDPDATATAAATAKHDRTRTAAAAAAAAG
jgi:hypothetical protein